MRPIEDACRDVLTNIDGVLLPTLLDLEAGVQLGVLERESPPERPSPEPAPTADEK